MRQRVAYVLSGLVVVMFLATVWFAATGRGGCLEAWTPPGSAAARECDALRATADVAAPWEKLTIVGLGAAFTFLGTFLLLKVTGNRFGAILCAQGLAYVLTGFGEAYTIHGLVENSLPGATAVAVVAEIVGGPIVFVPFAFFFLLFPTGTTLSPRWRPVIWAAVASGMVLLITSTFGVDVLRLARLHEHPLHLAAVEKVREPVEIGAMLVFLVALVTSIASLIIRFKRARGVERQQLRWFAAAGSFIAVVLMSGPIFWSTPSLEVLWGPLFVISVSSLPVAATIAILKYRLYDIDVIVNRALVYTALTGALATFYVGLVFVLQKVLPLQADSDVAVAASTLAAAALFRPLRRRIQNFIDRRFYRRRYDSGATLTRFGGRLRNQVELEVLARDLLDVVGQTVQPAHASLWLRAGSQ